MEGDNLPILPQRAQGKNARFSHPSTGTGLSRVRLVTPGRDENMAEPLRAGIVGARSATLAGTADDKH